MLLHYAIAYTQVPLKYRGKRGEEFLHYKLDTRDSIKDSTDINEIYRYKYEKISNSFIMYSIHNLWKEDSCGLKDYRMNIINFIGSCKYLQRFKIDDVIKLIGFPDSIDSYKPKDGGDVDFIYNIHYGENCNRIYYWSVLMFYDSVLMQANIRSNVNDY